MSVSVSGVSFEGNRSDVRYNISVQDPASNGVEFKVAVDWNVVTVLSNNSGEATPALGARGWQDVRAFVDSAWSRMPCFSSVSVLVSSPDTLTSLLVLV